MDVLLHELSGVRDGNADAVHDARVAVRRLREAAALIHPDLDESDANDIAWRLRRAGRALGRARDADVAHELIRKLEDRIVFAAAPVARLRVAVAEEQQRTRRRMIKTLESLELETIPQRVARARPHGRFVMGDSGWRGRLRAHIGSRAGEAQSAIHHAGGVYFPKRSHSARIAIKKLRYAVELACATRMWSAPRELKRLKKAQEALGEAHDREVLIEKLRTATASDGTPAVQSEVDTLISFLRAECLAFHARYLNRRGELLAVCERAERLRPARITTGRLIAAGVAVPSLLLLARND